MTVVARWSGAHARALREAYRFSVRDYAERLGVNDSAISSWERRGTAATLRHETQQILDEDLARASDEVQERFEALLGESLSPTVSLGPQSARRTTALLGVLDTDYTLPYRRPNGAAERLQCFLESPSRVYVVGGPGGSGKTQLIYHLARDWSGDR